MKGELQKLQEGGSRRDAELRRGYEEPGRACRARVSAQRSKGALACREGGAQSKLSHPSPPPIEALPPFVEVEANSESCLFCAAIAAKL